MKLSRYFTYKEHEDFGEFGWEMDGAGPAFGPIFSGITFAHDILEHEKIECVEDEFCAIGSMYWLRYLSGYVDSSNQYARPLTLEIMAEEFVQHYYGFFQEGGLFQGAIRTKKLDKDTEDDLAYIVQHGGKSILDEVGDDANRDAIKQIKQIYPGYFRRGFRRAEKLYKDRNRTCDLFTELSSRFRLLKHQEEGGELEVVIDLDNYKIEIKEWWDEM
jgi:hypothetical protein